MTDAPTPRPLPPERWVVETRDSEGFDHRYECVSSDHALSRARGCVDEGCDRIWFGQLRQFKWDTSPIDGAEPADDE